MEKGAVPLNYYPDQLRQIAAYCEALDKVEDAASTPIYPANGIRMVDNDGTFYGMLHDEIGGSWSFSPAVTP